MSNSPSSYDYLIVGQGLAGTLLTHFLQRAGKSVLVIDQSHRGAATQVGGGIINPITGRRFVKSWRIDDLLPVARETYRALEEELGIDIYQERQILRALFNKREENDWLARTGDPAYAPYMLDNPSLQQYAQATRLAYGYGEVQHGAQVDIGQLVSAYAEKLKRENYLRVIPFDYHRMRITPDYVQYEDLTAKRVVFCEGHQARRNPFFNYLPFGGAKGEVLIVKIKEAAFDKILKHRVFIVPLKDGLYWVGATYDWRYEDDRPTERGRQFLTERLEDVLTVPFEIVEHKSAIRPTVKDRRPFLGVHPEFPNLYKFNGLGTKGASLGPYWAKHFLEHLEHDQPLDPEVDIRRFAD